MKTAILGLALLGSSLTAACGSTLGIHCSGSQTVTVNQSEPNFWTLVRNNVSGRYPTAAVVDQAVKANGGKVALHNGQMVTLPRSCRG